MRRALTWAAALAAGVLAAASARAEAVGERHLLARPPSAALRDADHRDQMRVTVWYPAPDNVEERSLNLGPAEAPLFLVGDAAPDAPFLDTRRRPVILFSHGFGGTALMMGWFTTNLARMGYVVVAVDHPGNNGLDKMTTAGAVLFWDRPEDLKTALAAVRDDPVLASHLDLRRVGVAGFSAGGFAALAAIGAQVDLGRFQAFCESHPDDGVCRPQLEFPLSPDASRAALAAPPLAAEAVHANDDHTIPEVRAAFVMAPALVQALTPASLGSLRGPVGVILGDADTIAPPNTNGGAAARLIPGAELKVLPSVGHYDFLSTCTPAAIASVPLCANLRSQQAATHEAALRMAYGVFLKAFGRP